MSAKALARVLPDERIYRHRAALTGEPVPVVAVSRSGATRVDRVQARQTPFTAM